MNISQLLTKLKTLVYSKSETDSLLGGKASSSHTHTKSQITDFPSLATVATSGSYNDLSNKPTIPSNTNQLTNGAGFITSSGSCNYANSAGNSDTLDSYHEYSFLRYRGNTSTSDEGTLWAQIGIKDYNNALPDGLSDVYQWGEVVSLAGGNGRFEIYCSHNSSNGNGLYYRSGWANDKKDWKRFIDSANIGSQSVNYANSAGSAGSVAWGNVSGKPSTFTPSSHTHDDRYYTESEINTLLLSKVYPVGAIYISVNSVNPGTLFGGTWERIKDKFLLSSGDTYSIGSTGGNSSTTLGIANLPSHNHTGTTGNESQGHTHSGTTGNQSANHTHTFSGTSSSSGGHTHNTWTESTGSHFHKSGHGWHNVAAGSDIHCVSNSMINGDDWSGNITGYSGAHSHSVGMDSNGAHTHTYSGTTSGISANHTHSFTTGGISAHHTHSFTTSSVGSTQAFSNMPPYLTVNIWKRTA